MLLLSLSPVLAFAEANQGVTDPDPELVKKKIPQWREACEQNDGFACGDLGAVYFKGIGVKKDEAKAFELYEKACRFGQGLRCLRSGIFALNGIGTPANINQAAELFGLGCRALEPVSCANYYSVTHGRTITMNGDTIPLPSGALSAVSEKTILNQVVTVFTVACTKKIPLACGNLGGLYEEGDVIPRDLEQALRYYTEACELGEADRCARAGRFVHNGVGGFSPIQDKAAKLFDRFCELKKLDRCPLAVQARRKLPIELKITEPVKVETAPLPAKKPVEVTSVVAPLSPEEVKGEKKNTPLEPRTMVPPPSNTPPWARYPISMEISTGGLPEEVATLVRACNGGNGRACGNAAATMIDTAGKPKPGASPEVARQLFERACGLGRAQRCLDLARFHANGWGTEKSAEREKAAVKKACDLGNKQSCIPVPQAK